MRPLATRSIVCHVSSGRVQSGVEASMAVEMAAKKTDIEREESVGDLMTVSSSVVVRAPCPPFPCSEKASLNSRMFPP